MFFSYPSKDIKTKYSYEHVHRVLIKDRINKNASFSQSRPAEQSFSFDHTVPGSVPLPSDIQIFLPNYLRWAICTSSQWGLAAQTETCFRVKHQFLTRLSAARTVGNTFQSFPCPQTREPRKTPRTVSELFSASPISCWKCPAFIHSRRSSSPCLLLKYGTAGRLGPRCWRSEEKYTSGAVLILQRLCKSLNLELTKAF